MNRNDRLFGEKQSIGKEISLWAKRGVYVSSLLFISFINYLKNDCYIVQSLIFLILHNMATSCNMRVINNNYKQRK